MAGVVSVESDTIALGLPRGHPYQSEECMMVSTLERLQHHSKVNELLPFQSLKVENVIDSGTFDHVTAQAGRQGIFKSHNSLFAASHRINTKRIRGLPAMPSDEERLQDFLQLHPSVEYIRLQWIDFSGVLRARFVPVARSLRLARGEESCCLAQSSMIIPISTAPRSFSLSDYHETWFLRPDWSSLRLCGFKPNHAAVMSFVDQKDSDERFDKCPRHLLSQALHQLQRECDSTVLIGFEIEFTLLDESFSPWRPVDRLNGYSRTAGLRSEILDLVEDIVHALGKSAVDVHHFHAELSDQLEIALAPETALNAVDSLIMAEETIRSICLRRNIRATMSPKPLLSGPTNGLHLHLSIDRVNEILTNGFLAGILKHMESLCAFGMANFDSYARAVGDGAGAWIGYGTDNRDLPVRKITDRHWEFRMLDATANPYLFVAAVILAGLEGVRNNTVLRWRDCNLFPHLLDEQQRAAFGLDKSMPHTLQEALDCLKHDGAVKTWMSDDLVDWYLSVKGHEAKEFGTMTDEQRRLRLAEYF